MCFSAGASFTASAVLTVVGIAAQRKVKISSRKVFAAIPLIFALQQFCEGILWLTIPGGQYPLLQKVSALIFVIIAKSIWPVLLPIAIILMEENKKRRTILYVLLAIGIFSSLVSAYTAAFCEYIPQIRGHRIYYWFDFSKTFFDISMGAYLLSTVPALLVSSIKGVRIVGVLMAASCLISMIFFFEYALSVWCFFAAVLSVVIYFVINDNKAKTEPAIRNH